MNIRRLVGGGEGEEGACETIEYGEEQGGRGLEITITKFYQYLDFFRQLYTCIKLLHL